MKKSLILATALIACQQASAQQYIPMPLSDVVATYHCSTYASGVPESQRTTRFHLILNGEDTTIRSINYKKVMIRYAIDSTNPPKTVADFDDRFYAGIREDNKRVYVAFADSNFALPGTNILFTDTSKERLLYDFNMNVGDTILPFDVRNYDMAPSVVKTIDSILIGNRYHKRYNTTNYDAIIEGVGSRNGIFRYASIMYAGVVFHCQTAPEYFYNPYSDPCFYIWQHSYTSISNVAAGHKTVLYPNPFSDELIIDSKEAATCIISNALGQTVLSVQTREGQNRINTSGLPSGMYHVIIRNAASETLMQDKLIKQ